MSGLVSYHAGLSAEAAVAAHYVDMGLSVAAKRWRGTLGEVDLVLRHGATVVFVEVKKARNFDFAATRLTQRQAERIWATASEFLAGEPLGQNTETRVDLALVDGIGRVQIIENVMLD